MARRREGTDTPHGITSPGYPAASPTEGRHETSPAAAGATTILEEASGVRTRLFLSRRLQRVRRRGSTTCYRLEQRVNASVRNGWQQAGSLTISPWGVRVAATSGRLLTRRVVHWHRRLVSSGGRECRKFEEGSGPPSRRVALKYARQGAAGGAWPVPVQNFPPQLGTAVGIVGKMAVRG